MDALDTKILIVLQEDASLPVAAVADAVGLSVTPCWRRIRKLEEAGIILRRVTLLDRKAAGIGVVVFASVSLVRHTEQTVAEFDDFVSRRPEILEAHAVSGDRDYQLKIAVRDIEEYEGFLNRNLLALSCIASVNSRFMLREIKYTTALPLPAADGG
ncbi:MAG: Lrp/AsnC family transcriptional regulator [Alphaproteobacteria bacterium]|nr:Lrp/AsnC family transcriptional regulator [Alphaproteobacteria bacterium]MCZ6511678.1 Lrp/AsnC family transcriptional regulator [Alphaproteobacteria bacterium]MCZ6592768.1 Lrp/AsnC family transcriptional regulator [Alphaproteobacteria bacterium]MCZ6838329.1 Lrp/AsnC family transcriptional regulator [Alphaproteobacteria bacterium]MCZ6845143.1 Lrp/AsnC family transcriptional regulator [Alphaproteobacteria bacterium]